ncbi:MAG TPA: hypothetical protein EYP98_11750 [Planctomycetes bacterium]|nr:hypothetical protein [Planctomycetota bacterium]
MNANGSRPMSNHVINHRAGSFAVPRLRTPAHAAGLPSHLPFAIMRAESGFNPSVVSGAGARGLMQLMPGTAN